MPTQTKNGSETRDKRETKGGREKTRILSWRGEVRGDVVPRWVIGIVILLSGFALTFTQLGFAGVSVPGGDVGYIVVLLSVVALGALLLGTPGGLIIGLLTGIVLLLHSILLPLDHYELEFITPISSVAMFSLAGLLLGVLFAIALRNNPRKTRRAVYIAIVCVLVTTVYVTCFMANTFIQLVLYIARYSNLTVDSPMIQQLATASTLELGDVGTMFLGTALLMVFVCLVGDFAVRRLQASRGNLGLRSLFGLRLATVVLVSFMVVSAIGFAATSVGRIRNADEGMREEVNYFINQMTLTDERRALFRSVLEEADVSWEDVWEGTLSELFDTLEDRRMLEGYSVDKEGVVLLCRGEDVYASNDGRLNIGMPIEDALGPFAPEAVDAALESGAAQRFVYVNVLGTENGVDGSGDSTQGSLASRGDVSMAFLSAGTLVTKTESGTEVAETVVIVRSSDMVFARRAEIMRWMALASLVLLLSVFAMVFNLINRLVANRIDKENEALARITAGDLDARAEAAGTREFDSLSKGINTTVDTLKGWIAEAESRMDAELQIAGAIQESALPRTFPPFPDIPRFDVYASMDAAREVGGDFYDFFLIGEGNGPEAGKLGFVVADVSGKGVPAALFMMRAKTLLRDYVNSGLELGEAVAEVNRQLCEGNDEGMFVTAWVGVLDYGTGHVDYVNAGHNPPLLWQRDGGWRWMRERSGPMLGLFDVPYRTRSVDCIAGDTLLLYSDGVTEAFDVNERLYGEPRLLELANVSYRQHPRELVNSIRDDVARHAQGAEQSDDITILALEVGVPPEVTSVISVPADIDRLDDVLKFLHEELGRRLCPQRVQNQIDIAVEELFVNVCNYAYPEATAEAPGMVRVQRTYSADPPSVMIDIIDEGIPYDPLAKPDAVTPKDIADVPIGGLGILMAKRCVDEMSYERLDDKNVVTIVKKW